MTADINAACKHTLANGRIQLLPDMCKYERTVKRSTASSCCTAVCQSMSFRHFGWMSVAFGHDFVFDHSRLASTTRHVASMRLATKIVLLSPQHQKEQTGH